MGKLNWLLIFFLVGYCYAGKPVVEFPYEPQEFKPFSSKKLRDNFEIRWAIEDKDWTRLENALSGYSIDSQALEDFYKGRLTFDLVVAPEFFTRTYEWIDYPEDYGQENLIDILRKTSFEFKDLPFVPTLWDLYGDEAGMKAKAVYLTSKQTHPDMPVGLCVGNLSDGRPEALVEAVGGAYDWLVLFIGKDIETAKLYNWRKIQSTWRVKTGDKPLVIVGVWIKDGDARHVKDLNEILEYSGIAGCVYYEVQ